jgi:hypothetical protein
VVHQPQCRFFNWAARCPKGHTNPLARDETRRIAANIAKLSGAASIGIKSNRGSGAFAVCNRARLHPA